MPTSKAQTLRETLQNHHKTTMIPWYPVYPSAWHCLRYRLWRFTAARDQVAWCEWRSVSSSVLTSWDVFLSWLCDTGSDCKKNGKANAFLMLLLKLQVGLRISDSCCLVWRVLIRFLGTAAISHARHDSCKVKLSSSMAQIHAYAGLLKRVLFNNVQTKRIKLTLMTFD